LYLKRSNNIRDELQKSDLTDNSIDEELISLNKYIFLKKKRKNAVNAEENNIQFDENNFLNSVLDITIEF
jgi:hypothetical protein